MVASSFKRLAQAATEGHVRVGFMLLLQLVLPLLISCAPKGPFHMNRESVSAWIDRYENEEMVCYHMPDDSMTCRWKILEALENKFKTNPLFVEVE